LLQLLKKVNTMLLFKSKPQSRGIFIHLHSEGSQKLSPSLHESREVDDILLVNILCAGTIPTPTTNIYASKYDFVISTCYDFPCQEKDDNCNHVYEKCWPSRGLSIKFILRTRPSTFPNNDILCHWPLHYPHLITYDLSGL